MNVNSNKTHCVQYVKLRSSFSYTYFIKIFHMYVNLIIIF